MVGAQLPKWFLTGPASDVGPAMVDADAMSVLPSPGSTPPGLGLSPRTTRAWPPTYEMLSTPPIIRRPWAVRQLGGSMVWVVPGRRAPTMTAARHNARGGGLDGRRRGG